MAIAGYSNRSISEKLGVKNGMEVVLINPPHEYIKELQKETKSLIINRSLEDNASFIHFFTKELRDLKEIFIDLKTNLSKDGVLWISWPKKSSGVKTNLDENVIRGIGLKNGLVDIKVIAIDKVWSGLKFVYRIKDR